MALLPSRKPIEVLRCLNLDDFQYEVTLDDAALPDPKDLTESQRTARQLRSARDRFAITIPVGGNELCFSVDRAAVLDIYQQAIEKIGPTNHKQIVFEANHKIKTILGLRKAEAHDVVFTSGGMLLKPLEPQYAEPRIEYGDDQEGYRAAWRLKAWRKEGWPNVYPKVAIERERRVEKLPLTGGQGDVELLRRMLKWDEKDWGDEVDAN
ncbi:Nn.00g117580.m01.CDS01 [Neocucurbitaria sp. VM-36]